jgi:peptidoglycan/LPS O-acetylase OafA/YrhL
MPRLAESVRLGHRPALDGVRALAVGLVFVHHVDDVLLPGGHDRVPSGFLGVDIFFVLSGFLITSLLLEELDDTGRIDISRFLGRRAARLFPALVFLLAAHVVWVAVADVGITWTQEREAIAGAALYVSNWSEQTGWTTLFDLGHLWSLAVEMQFYLLWPLVIVAVAALARSRNPVLWAAVGVGIVVAVVARIVLYAGDTQWLVLYTRTYARLDALLIGAGLSLAMRSGVLARIGARWLRGVAVAGIVLLLVAALGLERESPSLMYGGFTVVALASAALIAGVLEPGWWLSDLLARPAPRLVGRVSYGIYLWHLPLMVAVEHLWPDLPQWLSVVVSALLTAGAVALSWNLVERPALAWARRSFARPAAPAPVRA